MSDCDEGERDGDSAYGGGPGEPMKIVRPKNKYPYLPETSYYFDDEVYNRRQEVSIEYTRKYLQARILFQSYKGTLLMRVFDDGDENRPGAAWLTGDDMDALITILRDAKKTWVGAYRKAQREHAKNLKARRVHQARMRRAERTRKKRR